MDLKFLFLTQLEDQDQMKKMVKTTFFVNNKKFKNLIKKKMFLEHAKVFKNYYGSLEKTVTDKLNKGENVIFDIDWQGTNQILNKRLKYKIITIFILPPSKEELFNRLLKRDKKDKKIAIERMKKFKRDVMHWVDYDLTVINDKVEKCYEEIVKYIKKQKNRKKILKYNRKPIKNHILNLIN